MQTKEQKISPIKQRILYFAETLGISKRNFYSKIGVSRGTLESNTGITEDVMAKFIATYPNINLEWLLTGKGSMVKDDSNNIQIQNTSISSAMPATSMNPSIGTPYYDVDFIGGFDEVFNSQINVPNTSIVIRGFEKASLWCNVTGHSMEPKINHGDIIALRQCTLNDIQYGEIYAVVLDTIRTIKILRKSPDPNKLRFIPINTSDYDEQEFDKSRIINIFEVIGSISKFF